MEGKTVIFEAPTGCQEPGAFGYHWRIACNLKQFDGLNGWPRPPYFTTDLRQCPDPQRFQTACRDTDNYSEYTQPALTRAARQRLTASSCCDSLCDNFASSSSDRPSSDLLSNACKIQIQIRTRGARFLSGGANRISK